ncbi:MAG: Gfo/Idh/MocA family oxidoreductase [Pirellulales bacterium]|nr:Gfo/Idh/MocA family oxidoreductase [Pirellulales bacterium]
MTIRWGAIGCGSVAEVKSAPGLQKAEGSRLVAVMRRNASLAEDYARRHGVPRWTADAEALIRDPEVDAVYIATPPGSHLEYALRVAAAGKPAYVEKPMARNHAECRRMIDAFADAGLPLFVAYYRRRLPRFLKVKELVDAGRLGRIAMVSYRYADAQWRKLDPNDLGWRYFAEHAGGGIFMDLGSHALDILDFILGPIESAQGAAANLASPCEVEDAVAMHFRFASGALGAAVWNFAGSVREDLLEITGTLGKIELPVFGDEPVRLTTTDGAEVFDLPNPPHIQQPLIQSIVDQLHGRGQCPSTGETAARTAAVMDRALEDYYGRRDDEYWTRPQTWPGRRK